MKKTKNNPLTFISELLFYFIGILSVVNIILIANNEGTVLRIPSGLLLSNAAVINAWDLVIGGMLGSMGLYWVIIAIFGVVPALIMIVLGFLIRRQKKQALLVGIALMIADSFILFSFLDDTGFLLLNAVIRVIVLVFLILGAKNMKIKA